MSTDVDIIFEVARLQREALARVKARIVAQQTGELCDGDGRDSAVRDIHDQCSGVGPDQWLNGRAP